MFSQAGSRPEDFGLPDSSESDDSGDSGDENVGGTQSLTHSPLGGKSDQLAPQTVTPHTGTQTQGDVTSSVTDTAVTPQDHSPVQDSARSSSPTPVKQEVMAAQSFEVSAEVYAARDSESDAVSASLGQTPALSRMSLGTQVGSDLSYTEGLSLDLPQSTDDGTGPFLEIDPSKPLGKIASQLCAQLQLTHSRILGGAGLVLLSDDDLVVFKQWEQKVGLENLPQLQPKQVKCLGVRELVHVLQGTQIRLTPVADDDSDTSYMDITRDSSFPTGFISSNPLGLESGVPTDLEDREIIDNHRALEPMDQTEDLDYGFQSTGGALSDVSVIPGGVSDPRQRIWKPLPSLIPACPPQVRALGLPKVARITLRGGMRKTRPPGVTIFTPKHDPI